MKTPRNASIEMLRTQGRAPYPPSLMSPYPQTAELNVKPKRPKHHETCTQGPPAAGSPRYRPDRGLYFSGQALDPCSPSRKWSNGTSIGRMSYKSGHHPPPLFLRPSPVDFRFAPRVSFALAPSSRHLGHLPPASVVYACHATVMRC